VGGRAVSTQAQREITTQRGNQQSVYTRLSITSCTDRAIERERERHIHYVDRIQANATTQWSQSVPSLHNSQSQSSAPACTPRCSLLIISSIPRVNPFPHFTASPWCNWNLDTRISQRQCSKSVRNKAKRRYVPAPLQGGEYCPQLL